MKYDLGRCFSVALVLIVVAFFAWSYSRLGTFAFWSDCARLEAYCSGRTKTTFKKIGECLAIKLYASKLKPEHCGEILREVKAKPWVEELMNDLGLK